MSEAIPNSMTDVAELLNQYAAGKRNFTSIELSAVDLRTANLKGADLSYAELSGTDLSGANLRGVDLSYANLNQANLSGANLRGAILIGTDLRHAKLETADLREADYDPDTTHFPPGFDPIQAGMRSHRHSRS